MVLAELIREILDRVHQRSLSTHLLGEQAATQCMSVGRRGLDPEDLFGFARWLMHHRGGVGIDPAVDRKDLNVGRHGLRIPAMGG